MNINLNLNTNTNSKVLFKGNSENEKQQPSNAAKAFTLGSAITGFEIISNELYTKSAKKRFKDTIKPEKIDELVKNTRINGVFRALTCGFVAGSFVGYVIPWLFDKKNNNN